MTEKVDWLWYGVDEEKGVHITFGRWKRHACQHRYKYAQVQPTEHDHGEMESDDAHSLAIMLLDAANGFEIDKEKARKLAAKVINKGKP